MAKVATFILFTVLCSAIFLADGADDFMDRRLKELIKKKEKLSHFRLYWHDVVSGRNATSIRVVPPVNGSQVFFGMVNVIDNPLTTGPEIGSKLVGRAEGLYAQADQDTVGLLMVQNFIFTDGKYNGSTIAILGRNAVMDAVRELPIIGGSGLFRFARGYVEARTHTFDQNTGDATVEYNIYVLHY